MGWIEIAWAAGLFEGEGHFSAKRRNREGWRVQFTMGLCSTDEDVLRRFAAVANCGWVNGPLPRKKAHFKPQWTWQAAGEPARKFAEQLRPYLGDRRRTRLDEMLIEIEQSLPQERECECCGTTFLPERFARQRFCSYPCRDRAKYLNRVYGTISLAKALELGFKPTT